jgi:hypothetical protein
MLKSFFPIPGLFFFRPEILQMAGKPHRFKKTLAKTAWTGL